MQTCYRVFLSLRAYWANFVTCPCAATEFRIVRLKYRAWHALKFGTRICVCFTPGFYFVTDFVCLGSNISLKRVARNDFKASCNRDKIMTELKVELSF